jgi:hypothetical protein
MNSGVSVAILITCSYVTTGCEATGRGNVPAIEFTQVPAAGAGGSDTHEFIEGRVSRAGPKQQLVIYAKSGKLWWVQPSARAPFTSIQPDLTWKNWTHRGVEYAVLMVNPGYKPPPTLAALPEGSSMNAGGVIAQASVQGKGGGYIPPAPVSIRFSGYDWEVRQEPGDQGGKTNLFVPGNVWTDAQGFLHLRIAQKDGQWTCGEVRLKVSRGHGLYLFTIRDLSQLDPAAVLSLKTWDDVAADQNHRDVGIEVSRWGEPTSMNAQYIIQPYYEPSNVFRFVAPAGTLRWSFRWEPGRVAFQTAPRLGNAPTLASHVFTSGVPLPGGESVEMTLYVYRNSRIPLKKGSEVVIEKFEYLP